MYSTLPSLSRLFRVNLFSLDGSDKDDQENFMHMSFPCKSLEKQMNEESCSDSVLSYVEQHFDNAMKNFQFKDGYSCSKCVRLYDMQMQMLSAQYCISEGLMQQLSYKVAALIKQLNPALSAERLDEVSHQVFDAWVIKAAVEWCMHPACG